MAGAHDAAKDLQRTDDDVAELQPGSYVRQTIIVGAILTKCNILFREAGVSG
jgi:hypothetical protein